MTLDSGVAKSALDDESPNTRNACTAVLSCFDFFVYRTRRVFTLIFDIELEFIHIAPGPVFARLDRTRDGVLRRMEVLGRVSVL